ncbi:MAG: hypothetical protein JOZ78_08110 [Chroococcidiopsidaceae cyanobacterium CP_BM_ER_R8_30]|nr:hypothetical protein [Chroococcidiopsidaceae cyanobacterium CP_BM_ER_R8_30]
MSEPKQSSKPFPRDDSIIAKLPQGTRISLGNTAVIDASQFPLHIPTKEFVNKIAAPICKYINSLELFQQGTKVEILEPEKKWVTGKIRLRLVFDFIPDGLEINKTSGEFVSPLDEIRNRSI